MGILSNIAGLVLLNMGLNGLSFLSYLLTPVVMTVLIFYPLIHSSYPWFVNNGFNRFLRDCAPVMIIAHILYVGILSIMPEESILGVACGVFVIQKTPASALDLVNSIVIVVLLYRTRFEFRAVKIVIGLLATVVVAASGYVAIFTTTMEYVAIVFMFVAVWILYMTFKKSKLEITEKFTLREG